MRRAEARQRTNCLRHRCFVRWIVTHLFNGLIPPASAAAGVNTSSSLSDASRRCSVHIPWLSRTGVDGYGWVCCHSFLFPCVVCEHRKTNNLKRHHVVKQFLPMLHFPPPTNNH